MSYTPSLRARVAVATALGAALIAAVIVAVAWQTVATDEYRQLDNKLALVNVVTASTRIRGTDAPEIVENGAHYVATVRRAGEVTRSTALVIPPLHSGTHDVKLNGREYRIRTEQRGSGAKQLAISVGLPLQPTLDRITSRHQSMIWIAAVGVVAAAALGWLLGGLATRPFRDLARATASGRPSVANRSGLRGALEAREIAQASDALLGRLDAEHTRTAAALSAARDFAAVSAHELRSPLTSMRTDIDLLRGGFALTDTDRTDVANRLARTHQRVINTLSALEALAQGELINSDDFATVDVVELCDRVVSEQRQSHDDIAFHLALPDELTMPGFAPGLQLALDNAIINAIRHGHATTVGVLAERLPTGQVHLCVDDDGRGVPPDERAQLFGRFARGSTADGAGSGIGLALIAQQAQIHSGTATLTDSPLGGTRVEMILGTTGRGTALS